jgi:hypothetical protein
MHYSIVLKYICYLFQSARIFWEMLHRCAQEIRFLLTKKNDKG